MRREIPILGAVAGVVVDLVVFGGELIATLAVLSEDILPILSVLSAYVAPAVAWIDGSLVQSILLVVALIYIGFETSKLVSERIA